MLESKTTCQEWKHLILKAMCRKHVKRWREIVLDLLCVDLGLKPALLWDYASISEESMEFFLTEAKKYNLLSNSLRLVVIESDMILLKDYPQEDRNLIIPDRENSRNNNSEGDYQSKDNFKEDNPSNPKETKDHLDGNKADKNQPSYLTDGHEVRFIDVTYTLTQPKLADVESIHKNSKVYSSILRGARKVSIEDNNFNPTSLFGLLLGYPIVYWYDIDVDTGSNCLSYQPMRVFKLTGNLGEFPKENLGLKSHTVFSFSVPECVIGELGSLVSQWKERHINNEKWRPLFDALQFEEEIKCLPSVCL